MRRNIVQGLFLLALGLAAACAGPQTRQFEVRIDDAFHTVTETRSGTGVSLSVRVGEHQVPCAALPCAAEVRAARGADGIDDFRRPPPGVGPTAE